MTPRITETAKTLWKLYAALVVLCIVCLWTAGMPLFNAIGESYSIVATGGFSMHAESIGHYDSKLLDLIATVFMFLGATNFALHFRFARDKKPLSTYLGDEEFKLFLGLVVLAISVTVLYLAIYHLFDRATDYIVHAVFTIVALMTTTGLTTTDFHLWPSFLPYLVMCLAIIGGCGGSTTGGIKVIRLLILCKQSLRELKRLIHPRAVYTLKIGHNPVPEATLHAVWAFVTVFIGLFTILLLILMGNGMDFTSAFGSVVATLANAGAPIGYMAHGFHQATTLSKWVMIVAMFAGRFEIFTILVLLTPEFWRQ